jgi:hypothetical protein
VQAILVAVVFLAKGQVDDCDAMWGGTDAGNSCVGVIGKVDVQPFVGQDFDEDLLPGPIVLDHQRARGRRHGEHFEAARRSVDRGSNLTPRLSC